MMRVHDTDNETTAVIPIQTLRELADVPHSPSPHMENSMPDADNWVLENAHADTVKCRQQFDLRIERRTMGALLFLENVRSERTLVRVTFNHAIKAHARAEAARLYALILDTIGDLERGSDEPLQVDDDVLFTGTTVELVGRDAFLVACSHFLGNADAGNAADAMMGAVL